MALTRLRQRGFTLVELAVVMVIVGLLIMSAMMTLTAQAEQRAIDETRRRLEAAADALVSYAVVNGRLPCPAIAAATGDESPVGTGACTNPYGGFLPARTIGMQPTDNGYYALDAWLNRIRYAVSVNPPVGCTGTSTAPHFTNQANLKGNGVSCKPSDLDVICSTVAAGVSATCNVGARVVDPQTIAFIVWSVGKNGATAGTNGADELENLDGNARFVNRTLSGSDSIFGTYDDLMLAVPAGVFYSRLIAAGVLP